MIQYDDILARWLGPGVLAAAQADAKAKYPQESCGFVADGRYVSCQNKAADPTKDFVIDEQLYVNAVIKGTLKAVIHSHPDGPIFPNTHDMQQQIATGVPWFILTVHTGGVVGETVAWGDGLPRAPIIGRPFVHGVLDCYSLIRDVYGLGKDALAAQGIEWTLPPIKLAEFPRDDNWWQGEADLYWNNFKGQGFTPISRAEVKPGDLFLHRLGNSETNPKKKICHGGLLLPRNMILHHLPGRISRREPAGAWALAADLWLRCEANK